MNRQYINDRVDELNINKFTYNAVMIDLDDIEKKGYAETIFKDSILVFEYLGFKIEDNKEGIGKIIKEE